MSDKNSYMVFSGTATKYLAEKICQSLGCPLGQLLITKFSDGEFAVSFEEKEYETHGVDYEKGTITYTFTWSNNLLKKVEMEEVQRRILKRAEIEQRADDTPATVKTRVENFFAQTMPLVDYYRNQGKLVEINGMQDIEHVFADICAVVEKL